ncbi:hypothetical protein SLEP1_g22261 [Rubroshorea leprosula]|uniref:Uncharacterized protein n=1 Tax=Rubroshorea leprosula TaxID=152421 RepID=A0AAV5JEQ4_9ROSI|nr:hypothetical protein SLEP1_g22261 [Rubroshorea leprosula]
MLGHLKKGFKFLQLLYYFSSSNHHCNHCLLNMLGNP